MLAAILFYNSKMELHLKMKAPNVPNYFRIRIPTVFWIFLLDSGWQLLMEADNSLGCVLLVF